MKKTYYKYTKSDDSGGGEEEDLGQYGEYFWIQNNGKYKANIYVIQSGYSSETITIQYSYDKKKWTELKASLMLDRYFTLDIGQIAYLRGNNKSFNSSGYTYEWNGFTSNRSTNVLHIGGNIMSLFYGDNFKDTKSFDSNYRGHCMGMFVNFSGLTDASQLVLPVKEIYTVNTYSYMFYECGQLIYPPVMDLTYIGTGNLCSYMFYNCTKLVETPDLKPINMNYNYGAYSYMFQYCTSLNKITIRMVLWGSSNGNYEMFKGIGENGTIYMPSNATWYPSSYGVPSSWTVSKTL